ncbi:hypothetical protein EJ03DRAFT_373990 [Teratosphaeria nubilosa]|uniref:Uncharacterized protein n=1 Tax=Teratosphaeria nubilosa TaxID=161662 RepID=A0A6G1LB44_9PEZI|nr:hypothetical protein EJ03DRAFT_373990 [Teratosphaeria nubilosa]
MKLRRPLKHIASHTCKVSREADLLARLRPSDLRPALASIMAFTENAVPEGESRLGSERVTHSFDSDATEVTYATWEFWTSPPQGDFARLIPACDASKELFQQNVPDVEARKAAGTELFSDRFLHYENTTPEHAHSPLALSESTSASGRESLPPSATGQERPHVTGFYRLNMETPAPVNPGLGWRIGAGRSDLIIEIVLASRKQHKLLRGAHARLKRLPHGPLMALADNHEFFVGNDIVKPEGPGQPGQRSLGLRSTLHIAGLSYTVEMLSTEKAAR